MRNSAPVLLIEDNRVDVMTVQRSFKGARLTNPLFVASNGEEAFAFLRCEGKFANREDRRKPCLILLDINMPIMTGLEFLRIAKQDEELRRIPIVVLTTSKEESDRVDSFNLSVAGYIIKPVDYDKFTEIVKVLGLYWSISELPD